MQLAFVQDQVGLDVDGFRLDHVFPDDCGLEDEDEVDIIEESLFEDKLATRAAWVQPKRKSRQTKAYTAAEEKLCCECWRDIGQDPKAFQALYAFKVQHEGKSFNLSHCWRIINHEKKFKIQYATLTSHGGKEAVEEIEEGEKPRPRGKTNSKKEDKRNAASIALIATVEDMISKKDSRE
ncbi:Phospholipid-transporting ATPase 1 [Hordeum vulgare]|nr:Phospholipid-transporting ATPase 1 [Hordeum vulgare]